MTEEGFNSGNQEEVKKPITNETKEWGVGLDTTLPIDGPDLPDFKSWINWNGFHLDRETGKGHDGYDFAAYLTKDNRIVFGLPANTKIRAVADGRVEQVLDDPDAVGGGYGVMITLEHGANNSGLFSTYIHVKPLIKPGIEVKKGDVIGELYKDPGAEKGRLVHLHLRLVDGWGTKGTSIMGGGLNKRLEDPKLIDESIYGLLAEPQGSKYFSVPSIPNSKIETANFQNVDVN
jgi:hypothetical protein